MCDFSDRLIAFPAKQVLGAAIPVCDDAIDVEDEDRIGRQVEKMGLLMLRLAEVPCPAHQRRDRKRGCDESRERHHVLRACNLEGIERQHEKVVQAADRDQREDRRGDEAVHQRKHDDDEQIDESRGARAIEDIEPHHPPGRRGHQDDAKKPKLCEIPYLLAERGGLRHEYIRRPLGVEKGTHELGEEAGRRALAGVQRFPFDDGVCFPQLFHDHCSPRCREAQSAGWPG
nr:hypothetical protein [Bradyrhizobium altum]